MYAIFKKEITSFFASPTGYLAIVLFLVLNGLMLWVFKGNFNIFDSGFAELTPFFQVAPWILTFLVPAICMKSFSDEMKLGTIELLLTKPISLKNIVLGKYLSAFSVAAVALLPTLLYIIAVWKLGNPPGNLDLGSTVGSYVGLLFLIASYTAIGLFSSTISENQVVAFLVGLFLCFFFYFGFEGISGLPLLSKASIFIENLGLKAHFSSIARGVVDTRDLLYFLSITLIFLVLTTIKLQLR